MARYFSKLVLASVGIAILCGCGPAEPGATTAAEKKAFAGGPMPPDAQKKFAEAQKKSAELRAKHLADAKAAAGH
jgi:hypothetical protein